MISKNGNFIIYLIQMLQFKNLDYESIINIYIIVNKTLTLALLLNIIETK